MWKISSCVLVCLIVGVLASNNDTYPNTKEREMVERWHKFEGRIKDVSNKAVKMIMPMLVEAQGKMNVSSQCIRETITLINGARKIKAWALRFLDASGKMIDGILSGTMSAFGAYDQCLDTVVYDEKPRTKGHILFRGQYCSLDIKPPLPPKPDFYKLDDVLGELKDFSERDTVIAEAAKYAHFFYFISLRLGLCVPSGCSLQDIDQIGKMIGDYLFMDINAFRCEIKSDNEFPPLVIIILFVFGVLGALVFSGTLMEIYSHYKKRVFSSIGSKLLLAFSFSSNYLKFTDTTTSSEFLSCLNGIRFLCMSWVVLGHTYLNINYQLFKGLESVRAYAKDFAFQAVVNASVAVDTFYCISGLLVCYLTIKLVTQEKKPFNIKLYVFHRLWRIYPVYAAVISFMFLANMLGSGPLWYETTDHFIQSCYRNWWTNFLFINNFYNADDMCIPQSWYIATDMQLYLAALLVLLPIVRWPKVGLSLAGIGVIASMVYSGVATYLNDYPPTMLFAHPDPEQRTHYWATFYFKPYAHAGPYCIGLIAGYLLATKPKLKIPTSVLVIGWLVAIIGNMSVLYGVLEWNSGRDPTFWETMIYSSCNRVVWTIGVAWMIVCCALGYGGIINYILSWKIFIPLGRLTFVVFLIHPIVQVAVVGAIKAQVQPQHFFAVWVYLGHMCVTYAAAFAGSMIIEAPFLRMEKIIIPRPKDSKPVQRKLSTINGNLKVSKNGDLSSVVPIDDIVSEGSDNRAFVYKL